MDGVGTDGEVEPQRAFDSIEYIGNFIRGDSSGIDGGDRFLEFSRDVDVLEDYYQALPAAGWEVSGAFRSR